MNKRGMNAADDQPAGAEAGPAGEPPQGADRDFVTALARGLAVIQAFTNQQRQLSIAQISYRTGITRAAVRRYLHTLEVLGYVACEDGRRFSLRPKIVSLGHAYLSGMALAHWAQPVLDRLSQTVEEACSLAVLDGQDILYVARSTSSRIISPSLNVGSRLPAYCTSIGLVILAYLPEPALEDYLAKVRFIPFTSHTIISPEALREVLALVRAKGYAVADQQIEIGLRSIAVPVRNTADKVVAGINVLIQSSRLSVVQMEAQLVPPLLRAAEELTPAFSR